MYISHKFKLNHIVKLAVKIHKTHVIINNNQNICCIVIFSFNHISQRKLINIASALLIIREFTALVKNNHLKNNNGAITADKIDTTRSSIAFLFCSLFIFFISGTSQNINKIIITENIWLINANISGENSDNRDFHNITYVDQNIKDIMHNKIHFVCFSIF